MDCAFCGSHSKRTPELPRHIRVWPDALQFIPLCPLSVKQIPSQLQVHPEIGRRAEESRQAQSSARCHASSPVDDLIDTLIGDKDSVGQLALSQAHWGQKLLKEHFARVSWRSMRWYAYHFSLQALVSVIIHDFDFIWAGSRPDETYSVLVVNADAVLSLAVACQCFQAISRWDTWPVHFKSGTGLCSRAIAL